MSGQSPTKRGSRDIIKGKERVDSKPYPSTDIAAEGTRSRAVQTPGRTETQASSKSMHHITSDLTLPKPRVSDQKRPPRNRNLLESVHAHLTLFPRGFADHRQQANTTAPDTQASSLHARLSDGNTDTPHPVPVKPFNHDSSTNGIDLLLRNSMSAPGIMARARARDIQIPATPPSVTTQSSGMSSSLLQLNGDEGSLRPLIGEMEETGSSPRRPVSDIDVSPERDDAPQADKSQAHDSQALECINIHKVQRGPATSGSSSAALTPPHESYCHVPSSHPKSDISIHDTITDTTPHDPSISALGARTRLIAKLEEERSRATAEPVEENRSQNSSFLDRTIPGTVSQLSMSQDPSSYSNIVDTQLIEVKLRTRTQLHVRLAAEKKSTNT